MPPPFQLHEGALKPNVDCVPVLHRLGFLPILKQGQIWQQILEDQLANFVESWKLTFQQRFL